MKLDTFRRLDDHARRIRQLERTEPESGGGDHADSDHADAFSALAHTHGPGGGSTAWADITGKPSTFPPDEHDPSHDDRFALIVHSHAAHADSDHDDRFSLLAHVHVVAWADITGKPSVFAPAEHDSDHSDVFSPLAHTHAAHADSDHDDRFSLLAHVHDWASLTGKPSTFTPTPQALDWLTDVATAGQATTNVLTYNGSSWVPAAVPAQTWASITGKPSTFPPTPLTLGDLSDVDTSAGADGKILVYRSAASNWVAEPSQGVPTGGGAGQALIKATANNYDTTWATIGGSAGIPPGGIGGQSLLKFSDDDYDADWGLPDWGALANVPVTFPPTSHDSDHDDRFSLLAHTHAAHADSDHDDRFSLLAHAHTAPTWTQVTGKPTVFTPDEHDTAHDDRFSLLAHTHAAHADSDHDDRFSLLAHSHTPLTVAALANLPSAASTPTGTTYWVTGTARWYVVHSARWFCPAFAFTGLSKTTTSAGQIDVAAADVGLNTITGGTASARWVSGTGTNPHVSTSRYLSGTLSCRVYGISGTGTLANLNAVAVTVDGVVEGYATA